MNPYSNFFYNAEKNPEKTALIYYGKSISYGQLVNDIRCYTSVFYNLGLRAGDTVTLSLPTTPESIVVTYALNMIGVLVCFVDVRFTARQISSIVRRTNSKMLFIMNFQTKAIARRARKMSVEHIVVLRGVESLPKSISFWYSFGDYLNGRHRHFRSDKRFKHWNELSTTIHFSDVPIYEWPANSSQFIFQTSGTTGKAKSVLISAENLYNGILDYPNMTNDYSPDDKILCIMPLFTLFGFQSSVFAPLNFGNTIDIVPIWKISDFIKIICAHRPQHIHSVPSHWESIFDKKNSNADLSFLKTAIVAGDIVKPDFEKAINDYLKTHGHKYSIRKAYGMTETSGLVAHTFNDDKNKYEFGFSGKVADNLKVQICENEICVLTATKSIGYLNNPDATTLLLRKHDDGLTWLHTGDTGHFDEQGNLYITGRLKNMIVRYDGSKIFPSEIENAFLKHPDIQNCAVVGAPDKKHPQSYLPWAFVTLKKNSHKNEDNLHKFAKKVLPEYLLPYKILIIKEIPLTKVGKTDYSKLLETIKTKQK